MDAIPVDTHVWQIALRDFNFALTDTKSITPTGTESKHPLGRQTDPLSSTCDNLMLVTSVLQNTVFLFCTPYLLFVSISYHTVHDLLKRGSRQNTIRQNTIRQANPNTKDKCIYTVDLLSIVWLFYDTHSLQRRRGRISKTL